MSRLSFANESGKKYLFPRHARFSGLQTPPGESWHHPVHPYSDLGPSAQPDVPARCSFGETGTRVTKKIWGPDSNGLGSPFSLPQQQGCAQIKQKGTLEGSKSLVRCLDPFEGGRLHLSLEETSQWAHRVWTPKLEGTQAKPCDILLKLKECLWVGIEAARRKGSDSMPR